MEKTVMFIENDYHKLNMMKDALGEVDPSTHCLSLVYGDEVMPAIARELRQMPDYIFLDVDMPRKSVSDLLSELSPLKATYNCKIAVFAPIMPRRVAYAYRLMGANYAFQKPVSKEGYREIFSRILH